MYHTHTEPETKCYENLQNMCDARDCVLWNKIKRKQLERT